MPIPYPSAQAVAEMNASRLKAQQSILEGIVAEAQRLLSGGGRVTGKDARRLHGMTGTLGAAADND